MIGTQQVYGNHVAGPKRSSFHSKVRLEWPTDMSGYRGEVHLNGKSARVDLKVKSGQMSKNARRKRARYGKVGN